MDFADQQAVVDPAAPPAVILMETYVCLFVCFSVSVFVVWYVMCECLCVSVFVCMHVGMGDCFCVCM